MDRETNAVESELTIMNVTSEYNTNNFTCLLNQNTNTASSTKMLSIAFKPIVSMALINSTTNTTIVSPINNELTIFNNTDVRFKCVYKANPLKANVKWLLDGVEQFTDPTANNEFDWSKRANRFYLDVKQTNLTCQVENIIGISSFTYAIALVCE